MFRTWYVAQCIRILIGHSTMDMDCFGSINLAQYFVGFNITDIIKIRR